MQCIVTYATANCWHPRKISSEIKYLILLPTIKKVKCTLVQALSLCTGRTAQKRSRGIALLFLDRGTRRGEGSASRPGRSLPTGKSRYPLYRGLGGLQSRSGQVRKISSPPRFDPRTVQPVASRYNYCATRPTLIIRTLNFCEQGCENP
jgi:hypothetical protein